MKKLSLLAVFGSLLFTVACINGGNGGFNTPGGNFSASNLNGQYAYRLTGVDLAGQFREMGSFTANGNGTITAGKDDFVQNTSAPSTTATGTYQVFNDGTGTITLNLSNGRSVLLAITLVNNSKINLVVAQENVGGSAVLITGAGVALKQDTTAFAAPPSGTYAFEQHKVNVAQGTSSSLVGAFSLTGGIVTGNEDVNLASAQSSLSLGGLFNSPDTNGRGTGNFTDTSGTSSFIYYIVDSNRCFLLTTDTTILGAGLMEKQSIPLFSNASLSGGYAFGSIGDTALNVGGVNTVGRFTADGAGGITNGAFDSVQDGTSSTNVTFTGSYTAQASGRVTVSLNPAIGSGISQVFWLVSPSRAFFLTNSASKTEDGTIDAQLLSTFSSSTLSGQYSFAMDGFDSSQNTFDRVGTIQWDGSGGLTLDEFINFNGINSTPGLLPGSYSVGSNGRATASVTTLSNNLTFYLISGSDAYILQNDSGFNIQGTMSKQQ